MILDFISYILILLSNLRWPEVELNHRHTDFQSVALPTELSGLFTVSLRGFSGEFFAGNWVKSGAVGEKRYRRPIREQIHPTSLENTTLTLFVDLPLC